jgi:predicted O-linked N-acetylglucosamine transferase (SPINDLY family)
MITASPEAYEAMAIDLARNPDRLRAIKRKLDANAAASPLFDTQLTTRHIEAAYEAMLARHQAGLPPDVIKVQP